MVVSGQTKLHSGAQKKTIGPGDVFSCNVEGQVSVENTGKGELCLVHIELKAKNL